MVWELYQHQAVACSPCSHMSPESQPSRRGCSKRPVFTLPISLRCALGGIIKVPLQANVLGKRMHEAHRKSSPNNRAG